MKKIQVKFPKNYRFVRTGDDHCYEIVSTYVYPLFPPEMVLVSKEGTKINYRDIVEHSANIFGAIRSVAYYSDIRQCIGLMKPDSVAMFGMCWMTVVAEIDSRGDLHLLPEKEQKNIYEFKVTEKHKKAFKEYKKKLEEPTWQN